jgi:hypothetical protein
MLEQGSPLQVAVYAPTKRAAGALSPRRLACVERHTCIPLYSPHHRLQPVRPLWRQMFVEAKFFEQRVGVGGGYGAGGLAGVEGEDDGDEALDDMGVRIAAKLDRRVHAFAFGGLKPDLADAALHLVAFDARAVWQRFELAAEIDDIAVAVFPIIEKLEISNDVVECGGHGWDIGIFGGKGNGLPSLAHL